MDTIIIRYEDNGSVCYDGKEYVESLSKVLREKSATGALRMWDMSVLFTLCDPCGFDTK